MAGPKVYGDDEERILRRIGAAVVVLWKDFPGLQQSRIIQQAVFTRNRVQTVQLNEQIRAFIRKHQESADAPRPKGEKRPAIHGARESGHGTGDELQRVVGADTSRSNINAEQRQNSLQDSRDTDQYHEQFEQLRQSTIIGKLVYRPEAYGADDNNNQNTNQS